MQSDLPSETRNYVSIIKSSGEALLNIIDDILDFSKVEAGKLTLETINFDLRSCVEGVGELLAFKAHDKSVRLRIAVAEEVPAAVIGDQGRLRQVLLNLTANAVKFTSKGEVTLSVSVLTKSEKFSKIEFKVSDTGMGIPSDRLPFLFDAFTQADTSTTRQFGGTGLGLAISNRIVNLFGSQIQVQSIQGKGSVFYFSLELANGVGESRDSLQRIAEHDDLRLAICDADGADADILRHQLRYLGYEPVVYAAAGDLLAYLQSPAALEFRHLLLLGAELNDLDLRFFMEGFQAIKTAPAFLCLVSTDQELRAIRQQFQFDLYLQKPVRHRTLYEALCSLTREPRSIRTSAAVSDRVTRSLRDGPRILLVEDNKINQIVTAKLLEKKGYRCDIAANGVAALEMIARTQYGLILMDCQMPEMDGYEATRRIRQQERNGTHIPIVALTANTMKGDRERCLNEGMDDFLAKPVNLNDLGTVLEKYLVSIA